MQDYSFLDIAALTEDKLHLLFVLMSVLGVVRSLL